MGFEMRGEIVGALNTVDSIHAYNYRPATVLTGDAWLKWAGFTRVAPGEYETAWQIIIAMPNNVKDQEAWITSHLDEITDAVASEVWITSVVPGTSDDAPALIIDCRE